MTKKEAEHLLYEYYNLLMDEFDGQASEEALNSILDDISDNG